MKFADSSKAVVLLSGGIDSSTVIAIAKAEGHELYAMSFDYNQRHRRELESAKMVAAAFDVKRHLIVNFDLRDIGGSALTTEIEIPKKARGQNLEAKSKKSTEKKNLNSNIPVTYVPARNTIFLSFSLAWAEAIEAESIFIGANAVDYSGYPDCRHKYLRAFEDMANLATKASVEKKMRFIIKAPVISMKKSEIITKGVELGLDYSLTWSCYDPQPEKIHKSDVKSKKLFFNSMLKNKNFLTVCKPCGLCESCRLREKGFTEAGLTDPLLSLFYTNEV